MIFFCFFVFLLEMEESCPKPQQNTLLRSDNAGCYSGNSVAEIMYNICKNAGVTLKRYDNNEPEMGKDQD